MRLLLACLTVVSLVVAEFAPEEAALIQVIDREQGNQEGIYIKVNGEHKDSNEEVYMQVNLMVYIRGGNVLVNDHILPFSELTTFRIQAQISEVQDGVAGVFEDATVSVSFFLHEQTEYEGGEISRVFRLETQIIETDEYDVHMFNVTEVVMELDTEQQEIRRTVTLISESESKLHKAKNCPMMKCVAIPGCSGYKRDENGCQTCQCAAMEVPEGCLQSCDGACGSDPYTFVHDSAQDADGCWICPCLVIDDFGVDPTPTVILCGRFRDFGDRIVEKFEELPYSLRVITIVLLSAISLLLTMTCCVSVCCRSGTKKNRTKNLKAFGFGRLQIYAPDNEKKSPLIDNLDVVSADIA